MSEDLGDYMSVSDGAPKVDNQQHPEEDGPGEAPCSTPSAGLMEDPEMTAFNDGASKVDNPQCEDGPEEKTTPHASSSTFLGCQGDDKTTKRSDEGGGRCCHCSGVSRSRVISLLLIRHYQRRRTDFVRLVELYGGNRVEKGF